MPIIFDLRRSRRHHRLAQARAWKTESSAKRMCAPETVAGRQTPPRPSHIRRDVEDRGAWTPVQYYSEGVYSSREAALAAAKQTVAWLAEAIRLI
jgi:hypothetical protein